MRLQSPRMVQEKIGFALTILILGLWEAGYSNQDVHLRFPRYWASAIMVLEGGVGLASLKQASRQYVKYLETDKNYFFY